MYLGESCHTHLSEIQINISGPLAGAVGVNSIDYITPKQVISFVIETLGESKMGDMVKLNAISKKRMLTPTMMRANDQSGYFRMSGMNGRL